MNILIPMAGEGRRFTEAGYRESKPAILTYDRKTGKKKPMVVCAALDLPGVKEDGSNVIFVDRDFHREDGTEEAIRRHFPESRFITTDHLTEGQACTCMLAEQMIDNDEALLIAGCDNGMDMDESRFEEYAKQADSVVFTYRHNECVLANPDAYGWVRVDGENDVTGVSVKKAISDNPLNDHAIVATFWFRRGTIFTEAARKMIAENDRVNQEFYADQVIRHIMELGYHVKAFEIDRYIGWGTPEDYEIFQKTFEYWHGFTMKEKSRWSNVPL